MLRTFLALALDDGIIHIEGTLVKTVPSKVSSLKEAMVPRYLHSLSFVREMAFHEIPGNERYMTFRRRDRFLGAWILGTL